jgi:signal transduction histidine kinase
MRSGGRLAARQVRSTVDSVLLHDMKNLGFRLSLLLGNLEEHYGDPDFKRSVVELLHGTLGKLESTLENWSARKESLFVKVSLDLNDLVREVLRTARLRDGSRPSGTRLESDLGTIPPVWGDPHFLADALSSVLLNALEAAGPTGSVRVRTLVPARSRKRATVEIEDDGPGMTTAFIRSSLFRPFRSTKTGGVGLGLYTARQIVRFHGGSIRVSSVPGKGTIVRVTLPRVDEPS